MDKRIHLYDKYGRLGSQETKNGSTTVLTDSYTYHTHGTGFTSTQVKSLNISAGGYSVSYTYTYDANGNITSIASGGKTTRYTYDAMNQLTREDNEAAGKTWTWSYGVAGSLINRKEYPYTTGDLGTADSTVNYFYSNSAWGDLVTRYNHKDIQYDGIGNPLTDGTWTYSWDCRQLASMTDGTTTWSYKYNGDGLRTERSNGTTTYEYVYSGSSFVQMTVGSNVLRFAYDGSAPMTVTYNGTVYYYVTNLQGDIVAILDSTGTAVVQYTYDAWGKELTVTGSAKDTLGAINPLRYRGYVYDPETGRYYLQSRYYDPKMGRFINADAYASTGQGLLGNNMFAYCRNNPVCRVDNQGLADQSAIGNDDGLLLSSDDFEDRKGGGGGNRTFDPYQAILDGQFSGSYSTNPHVSGTTLPSSSSANGDVQTPKHTTSNTSPKNVSNPDGSHTQVDNSGKIKSYAQYDSQGRQSLRIDFQGKAHNGVLPHVHMYVYLDQGGRAEYIFDLNWNLIN